MGPDDALRHADQSVAMSTPSPGCGASARNVSLAIRLTSSVSGTMFAHRLQIDEDVVDERHRVVPFAVQRQHRRPLCGCSVAIIG
jgi:hypothetical protein